MQTGLDIPMAALKSRFILDVRSCHFILDGNLAGLSSFVSFSTHSVCNIYCSREFVSCTPLTNTYGGLDMQTGLDIPMAASK